MQAEAAPLLDGLSTADLHRQEPLYLWYIYGCFGGPAPVLFDCLHQPEQEKGMKTWRQVRDLSPGHVAIIVGPGVKSCLTASQAEDLLRSAIKADAPQPCVVKRKPGTDAVQYAVLSRDRASYVDPDSGIIDIAAYRAGELTKSMCAPWIYDFRECFCFYWASNKPDLVSSADERRPYLNFLRRDRGTGKPDVTKYLGREDTELDHPELLQGAWNALPVVLDGREQPDIKPLLNRAEAIRELTYLATIEHALLIEYLYGMYSLDIGKEQPDDRADQTTKRLYAVASQIREIAVDEMRHFLWVNQLLLILGAPPATGRATSIAEPPARHSGRRKYHGKTYLNRRFALRPLDRRTLQWFIDVEQPSQAINQGLDGMYVELLRSVTAQPSLFPEIERIEPVLKLIIDEGMGHYHRFVGARKTLKGLREDRYLRAYGKPRTALQRAYRALSDLYYRSVLDAVQIGFSLGESHANTTIDHAMKLMRAFDEINRKLISQSVPPRFTIERRDAERLSHDAASTRLIELARMHREALTRVQAAGSGTDAAWLKDHDDSSSRIFEQISGVIRAARQG
ncbi:MAG TPA: ferritin-like domain-containing protein [Stellaceae bacterium]|nr:ferritin-like domain-containing protein [Stellaceae bacterium]